MKAVFFGCFLCLSPVVFSQKINLDSLNKLPYEVFVSDYAHHSVLFKKAEEQAKLSGDTLMWIAMLKRRNTIEFLAGDVDKAMTLVLKMVQLQKKIGNLSGVGVSYCDLGYLIKREDLQKGVEYMRLGIQYLENQNDTFELRIAYDNFGVLKEFENQLDSALFYYKKALKLKRYYNDSLGIPFTYNKMAVAYRLKGNYERAIRYLDSSDIYRKNSASYYLRADNAYEFASVYADWGKPEKAIPYFSQAIDLAQKGNILHLQRDVSLRLSEQYANQGAYSKAFQYHKRYHALNDSLQNENTRKNMNALLVQYESAQKEAQIADQQRLLATETLKSRNRQFLSFVAFFALFCVACLAYFRIKRLRENRLAAIKAEQLKLQSERIRVSRDLHDHIGAELTLIASATDKQAILSANLEAQNALKSISQNARYAMQQLRETIWAISPDPISTSALALRLQRYAKRMCETSNMRLKMNANEAQSVFNLSPSLTINLFRVAQELVNNACKHADATEIEILFAVRKQQLVLEIKDNGMGFDENAIGEGYGIRNMRGRMQDVGAQFDLLSQKGKGTCASISVILTPENITE